MIFSNIDEVSRAYYSGNVHIHAKVTVRMDLVESNSDKIVNKRIETTVGRALFSKILPKGLPFELVNKTMDKKSISSAIDTWTSIHTLARLTEHLEAHGSWV